MSEKAEKKEEGAEKAAAAPSGPKGPMILALANTVIVMAALGMLAYTKLVFKRPEITEDSERARIAASAKAAAAAQTKPGLVPFDQVTVNIKPGPARPEAEANGKMQGKLHYCTLAFNLEIHDIEKKSNVDSMKAQIMDKLLSLMGRKQFHELTTVQGRYLLRQQIVGVVNEVVPAQGPTPLASDVFFTTFIVQ